jgi:enamine deaminase RidA (YjgF/YER057c/UK114 family)
MSETIAERAARAKQRPAATTVRVAALHAARRMLEVEVIARVPQS